MGILTIFVVSLVVGVSSYFGAVKHTKMNCEKNGYFVYVDENGEKEIHKCK